MKKREWSELGSLEFPYWSDKTREMIRKKIPERRTLFRKEFHHALAHEREFELKDGYRFRDDERILTKLERAYGEKETLLRTDHLIDKMLESMAYGDYYYTYEKDWG
jgi:hypothetical protein